MPYEKCPFCLENNLLRVNILYQSELWLIVEGDNNHINNSVMAITIRHIESPFELNQKEWLELHKLLKKMKAFVDKKELADGYNMGWNINSTGGQNVPHAHLHLLGRYSDEPLAGKGLRYAFKQSSNKRPTKNI